MAARILDSTLALVGPGRAGRAFALSWIRAGGRVQDIIARDAAKAAQAVQELGSGRPRSLDGQPLACDLLILGTPDDAIRPVAEVLASSLSCRTAFHLSGALSSRELDALARQGASIGSLHPLRAFSGGRGENWEGAFVAIEGDPPALDAGEAIVGAIGAKGRRIEASGKALYHAAATLAAGGSLALLSLAVREWRSLGISEADAREALSDLAVRAIGSASGRSLEDALTGPIARRDVGTVRAHRAALKGFPEAITVYAALARETLAQTPGRGKEAEIQAVLDGREL